jgi:threonine/homoserine/homoserine lactone efflux protein
MKFDIAAYLIFAFVTSITPGPNNLMLLSHGKAYGFNHSKRLMAGISLGFTALLYIASYGVARIITESKTIELSLKIVSSAWMVYLAFVLRNFSTSITEEKNNKIGFIQAFFLQFVNPKAWIMAVAAASAFLPNLGNIHLNVFVFAAIFALVGLPCMISWLKFGDVIAKLVKSEKSHEIIGWVLFGAMLVCVLLVWI